MFSWIPQKTLILALGLSAAITLASLILAPVIIARLPADYFLEERQDPQDRLSKLHPLLYYTALSLKNLLGAGLVVAGAVMVPFPGQGLLTMLVGLALVDFPGKSRLMAAIVRKPGVLRSLNWIRAKVGKPAFLSPGFA